MYYIMCCLCVVTEMLVNVLSLKDDDLVGEGDEKIKPGSGKHSNTLRVYMYVVP